LSGTLLEAYNSLRGLSLTKDVPNLTLLSENGQEGHITLTDFLGKPPQSSLKLESVYLISDLKERIEITEKSSLKGN